MLLNHRKILIPDSHETAAFEFHTLAKIQNYDVSRPLPSWLVPPISELEFIADLAVNNNPRPLNIEERELRSVPQKIAACHNLAPRPLPPDPLLDRSALSLSLKSRRFPSKSIVDLRRSYPVDRSN